MKEKVSVIITAGGLSQRYGVENKLFAPCKSSCVLVESIKPFLSFCEITRVIVAIEPSFSDELLNWLSVLHLDEDTRIKLAIGGNSRTQTVKCGLRALDEDCDIVLIHDGARPYVTADTIKKVIDGAIKCGASLPLLSLTDSLVFVEGGIAATNVDDLSVALKKRDGGDAFTTSRDDFCMTPENRDDFHATPKNIDNLSITPENRDDLAVTKKNTSNFGVIPQNREDFRLVQTPAGFAKSRVLAAYSQCESDFFDDISVVQTYCTGEVDIVEGDKNNTKITVKSDLNMPLVGCGYDIHRLVEGTGLKLLGTFFDCPYSFVAHSDGDVPIHALMDAILSAIGENDIGHLFPVDDTKYDGADSMLLLEKVLDVMRAKGRKIVNVSVTIIAQKPHISTHIDEMRATMSKILSISTEHVGICATSNEEVGEIGDGNAIASFATVLLGNIAKL